MTNLINRACHLCSFSVATLLFWGRPYLWCTRVRHDIFAQYNDFLLFVLQLEMFHRHQKSVQANTDEVILRQEVGKRGGRDREKRFKNVNPTVSFLAR